MAQLYNKWNSIESVWPIIQYGMGLLQWPLWSASHLSKLWQVLTPKSTATETMKMTLGHILVQTVSTAFWWHVCGHKRSTRTVNLFNGRSIKMSNAVIGQTVLAMIRHYLNLGSTRSRISCLRLCVPWVLPSSKTIWPFCWRMSFFDFRQIKR